MKRNLFHILSVGLAIVLCSAFTLAQETRDTVNAASSLYVISAKAGGVNYVEGKVLVARKNAKSGSLLKGDELAIGDRVSTGADGRAEILLNPGSFVRLAGNSTFEFASTSLEDLQLKLSGGSAMFEVITDDEFSFAVNTPKARFQIVKSGVYRIDVLGDGAGKIEVWKGRATANGMEVKGGRQATVNGSQTAVVKFDRGDKDALETWSKARAKTLAQINARLQDSAVRTSLMSSYYQTRWSLYNSYGLWIYSRFHGSYCFLPFGYGWDSPYGYYYRRDIWFYNLPPVIYNPPPPPIPTQAQTVIAAGASVRGGRPDRISAPTRNLPPYQRVQKDIGQTPSSGDLFGDNSSPSVFSPSRYPASSAPSVAPQPALAPPVSSPATSRPRKGN